MTWALLSSSASLRDARGVDEQDLLLSRAICAIADDSCWRHARAPPLRPRRERALMPTGSS